MQHYAVCLLLCKFTVHVSGANHTQASMATLEEGSWTNIWPIPEAVVTVLCTPDDGCG